MALERILLLAVAAFLQAAASAQATAAPAMPGTPPELGLLVLDQADGLSSAGSDAGYGSFGAEAYGGDGRYDFLRRPPRRYREPRVYRGPRGYRPPIVTQLSAGFYDPSGPPAKSFLLSARLGPQIDPHVQLGFMIDWAHKEDRVSEAFGHETVGGVDLSLEDSRLRGRSDLVPLLAFVQIGGDDPTRPVPYVGFGAGYELLSMEADRPDGTRFDGTFGGWGWQLWVGAGMPVAGQVRLNGEIFYNRADLGRDVSLDGRLLRQTADFDGPGLRLGLAWGF